MGGRRHDGRRTAWLITPCWCAAWPTRDITHDVSSPGLNRPFFLVGMSSRYRGLFVTRGLSMSKRVLVPFIAVVCFLLGLLLAPHLPFVRAQENKVKAPTW